MLLCEDNLVDWVNNNNGLMITRRKMNLNDFDFSSKKKLQYVCLTGYQKVITLFFEKLLHKFTHTDRFVLIIIETDEVYLQTEWLNLKKLHKIYCWNKPFEHEKVSCIPIGLNQNRQLKVITNWINERQSIIPTKTKLLCMNCSLCTSPERVKLNDLVNKSLLSFCDIIPFIAPSKHYFIPSHIEGKIGIQETNPQCYMDWEPYKFILSPQGAGLDCHRTWEALICGLIPIVKTSTIDEVFENLPVVIVNDWNEINEISLNQWFEDINKKKQNNAFNMDKLYLDYWTSFIEKSCHTRETHFITYGNDKYKEAKLRLYKQALQFEDFTNVRHYGPDDLPSNFSNKYKNILTQPRGGGFWLWKPMILYNHFKKMKTNDILVYLDAGCILNPKGIGRFREYVDILDKSEYGILSFQMHDQTEKWWTAREIFEYYNLDLNGIHANSGQFLGGVFMLKKNKHSEEYVKKLISITLTQSQLYTDIHNKNGRQMPYFKDNRHDQSISSLLRKLHKTEVIPRDESFIVPFGGVESLKYPFWAARSKK